jgi:cytochrome d ubiquinol oxidase subunit II
MWLNVVWYVLFMVIVGGYLILDGFDLGVGILHPFVAKNDSERRIVLNSIGPIWDGNEVWLVLAGGVLFAAFPFVYAALFSGFYLAIMLVLLCLILRPVAIEFRSQRPDPRWRATWDWVFFGASAGLALLLGTALGDILSGVPLDAQGNITVSLIDLLQPYPLLIGVTAVAMFAMHGGLYLALKTEGALQARIRGWLPSLMIVFFALNTFVVIGTVALRRQVTERYLTQYWPVIFPAAALGALILSWYMLQRSRYLEAFFASAGVIALLILSVAVGLYPNLLLSTISPSYNLTAFNAASNTNTLAVMLIIAAIGLPLVLLYTAGVYYFFKGKVKLERESY